MAPLEIVSLGQLVADVVLQPVDKLPAAGTAEAVGLIDLKCGGCALNTCIVMQKLGIATGMAGKIGQDSFGKFLMGKMKEFELDTKAVCDSSKQTSTAIVLISSKGERSFFVCPGGNEELTLADINFNLLKGAKILHVGGIMKLFALNTAELLLKAKAANMITSIDTDWDTTGTWLKRIEGTLSHVDILFSSFEEARLISSKDTPEDMAKFFLDRGVKIFVLKLGERGCYIKTNEQEIRLPAYRVKAIDTTGAGDAFVAGFLTSYFKGWGLEKTGRFANACGALCTTKIGTVDGIENLETTSEFIAKTPTIS